jgi:FkbH-like protein
MHTESSPLSPEATEEFAFQFAVSATFTAEPLEPVWQFWGRQLGEQFEAYFATVGQPVQTLLAPDSLFSRNYRGLNVVLVRAEDLAGGGSVTGEVRQRVEENLTLLVEAVEQAARRLPSPIALCLCPASAEFAASSPADAEQWLSGVAAGLVKRLSAVPGVYVLPQERIEQWYPVKGRDNPQGDRLGRIPYNDAYFAALGTSLVRLAHSLAVVPYKVIAIDCDNTLWRGVCGEDGPAGVVIGEPQHKLQEFMLGQRDAGMLLCLVSKNNEQDVRETFVSHTEMPLRPEHFTASRINWQPKELNLEALADELGLGLDSFVLVDDSAKETAEVSEAVPEVLALTLPQDEASIPRFLDHVWAFDHPSTTAADRMRSSSYTQTRAFERAVAGTASLEHFYRTLQLSVRVEPLDSANLARAAQLTQRTNQFNCSTIRRNENDLQALEADHQIFGVWVADRFGEYDLTGLVIAKQTGSRLTLDTFLLSCRVLGRGVEHRVLRSVGERTVASGADTVEVRFHRTERNAPAHQFLDEVAAQGVSLDGSGGDYRFSASKLAQLEFRIPSMPPQRRSGDAATVTPKPRRFTDYSRIATRLASADQIVAAMREPWSRRATAHQPQSEVERKLAQIWSELLQSAPIGADANFFDLGGHSLLAVLLAVRVKDVFGVEISMDDIYSSDTTLSGLARTIEARQSLSKAEYDALVDEIAHLSDEEVRALLAEEEERERGG